MVCGQDELSEEIKKKKKNSFDSRCGLKIHTPTALQVPQPQPYNYEPACYPKDLQLRKK